MFRPTKLFVTLIKLIFITVLISFIIGKFKSVSNTSSEGTTLERSSDESGTDTVSNNPFRCNIKGKSPLVKEFYQLDCENPFLKNISSRNFNMNDDVCEVFNESDNDRTLYSRITSEFAHFPGNITHNDIKSMGEACSECHHIQIIDGQLYIVERPTAANFQTRARSIKIMLKQIVDTFPTLTDLEMFIHTRDIVNLTSSRLNQMKHKVPIFGFSKTRQDPTRGLHPDGIILIPCFTFWVFTAPNIGRWRSTLETLGKIDRNMKWKNRINKVMWRGARNGDRWWLTGIGERRNDSTLDIEFIDWKPGKRNPHYSDNFRTIQGNCQYKYLLHQEGWSYANRLKYLLLCGSAVIYANFYGWEEYWYHLLKHDYNILVFKDKGNEDAFKTLTKAIIHDDEKAKFIGTNGKALVQKYLSEQAVFCYFRNVLIEYGKLFAYRPVLHKNAVTIDDFSVGYSS